MDIKGAQIIITGAGSGFGKAMAMHFSKSGAGIAALDIDQNALDELKKECPGIEIFVCDVTDNSQVENTMIKVFSEFGRISVLINNAGIMKNAPLNNLLSKKDRKHPLDLYEKVIAVNQNAVFYTTRSWADQMIAKRYKGVIINISSISARGNIGQTAYSASKAAVEAMTKVWAKEFGRWSIRSVAVAPGFIDTAGTAEAIEEKMLTQWIERTPLNRTGTIEEVVGTVQFAIENDFINGEVIHVNGGLSI
jgi:3-oxoacyl-[acyl-carrier protein] reductase